MEPLLDEDPEGSGNECNKQTQYPKGIDSGGNSRCLERRDVEDWDGRVDEISVDGQMGCLVDELHKEDIGEVFGLLLEGLVGLNDECGDDCREQTSLSWMSLES